MRRLNGFSLMEMMIVLLITAIIAAATAPMINRKMLENQAASTTPWVYTSDATNDIAFNLAGKNQTATIGALKFPLKSTNGSDANKPAMFIKTAAGKPHISLLSSSNANTNNIISIGTNDNSIFMTSHKNLKGLSDTSSSVIIGNNANASGNVSGVTAIGCGAKSSGNNSIAIGIAPETAGERAIAMGYYAKTNGNYAINIGGNAASGENSVGIGYGSSATANNSVALGIKANANNNNNAIAIGANSDYYTTAQGKNSIAIGNNTNTIHDNSVAIGVGASAGAANEIVLGTPSETVHVPGNLVVDGNLEFQNIVVKGNADIVGELKVGGNSYLGCHSGKNTYIRMKEVNGNKRQHDMWRVWVKGGADKELRIEGKGDYITAPTVSDRRLKNVGKAFTGGLEEIKKLEVFNYTFKKDPDKTPHVGVMAQDLEKIFPKAVFKGDDGFLRIRMEDMFYALVNAVKELSNKIESLLNNEITTLQKQVSELEKQNQEIKELNEDLIKRIEKLEKAKK